MEYLQSKFSFLNMNYSVSEDRHCYRNYNACPTPYTNPRVSRVSEEQFLDKHSTRNVYYPENRSIKYTSSYGFKQFDRPVTHRTAYTRLYDSDSDSDRSQDDEDSGHLPPLIPRNSTAYINKIRAQGNVTDSVSSCLTQARHLLFKKVVFHHAFLGLNSFFLLNFVCMPWTFVVSESV